MHYVSTNGVNQIVRVIDTNNLIYKQAINLASKFQTYSPIYVHSMDEAEGLLDAEIRRNSLRFNLINKDVEITSESFSAVGKLIDISVSGCAIKTDQAIELDQKLRAKLSLSDKNSELQSFEFNATSCRLIDDGFAVLFDEVEESDKKLLWECLIHESKLK